MAVALSLTSLSPITTTTDAGTLELHQQRVASVNFPEMPQKPLKKKNPPVAWQVVMPDSLNELDF